MLDDLNTELENADSKLDSTIKKVAKVLHMNNGEHVPPLFFTLGIMNETKYLFILVNLYACNGFLANA